MVDQRINHGEIKFLDILLIFPFTLSFETMAEKKDENETSRNTCVSNLSDIKLDTRFFDSLVKILWMDKHDSKISDDTIKWIMFVFWSCHVLREQHDTCEVD